MRAFHLYDPGDDSELFHLGWRFWVLTVFALVVNVGLLGGLVTGAYYFARYQGWVR